MPESIQDIYDIANIIKSKNVNKKQKSKTNLT